MSYSNAGKISASACVTALLTLGLIGCGTGASASSQSTSAKASTVLDAATAKNVIDTSSLFSERDLDSSYDEATATNISLSDSGSSATGDNASNVVVDGQTVTIKAEGTYILSGSLSDGTIVIDAGDDAKVQLVLNGATISSQDYAALYVKSADKVFLTLAEGSTNSLSNTGDFVQLDDNSVDAAIFSKSDLSINGEGSLDVKSSAGHGIVSKDELTLVSGNLAVEAAKSGLSANDWVAACGGTYNITAGVDGIHAENSDDASLGYIYLSGGSFNISSASDGLDAASYLQIDGGELSVAAEDDGLHAELDAVIHAGSVVVTKSNEALEGSAVTISGGNISLNATDDGINAAGTGSSDSQAPMDAADSSASITISGGTVEVTAAGDGLDSNGDLTITGGTTYVWGSVQGGNGMLDYAGEGTISGGVLVTAGTSDMLQMLTPTGDQAIIATSATGNAGDAISLSDSSGNTLVEATAAQNYQAIIVSAPGLSSSGDYTLNFGSNSQTITMSSSSYNVAETEGQMGQGGPGQMGQGSVGAPLQ